MRLRAIVPTLLLATQACGWWAVASVRGTRPDVRRSARLGPRAAVIYEDASVRVVARAHDLTERDVLAPFYFFPVPMEPWSRDTLCVSIDYEARVDGVAILPRDLLVLEWKGPTIVRPLPGDDRAARDTTLDTGDRAFTLECFNWPGDGRRPFTLDVRGVLVAGRPVAIPRVAFRPHWWVRGSYLLIPVHVEEGLRGAGDDLQ